MGDVMNAGAIVALADGPDGIAAVAAQLDCGRQQAETIIERARARVRDGAKAARPPKIGRAFTDAEVRAMADKIIPPALVGMTADEYHAYQEAEKERLRRERNRENGHPEIGPLVRDFEPASEWLKRRERQR
jgi:hypothetical protein